MHIRSSIIALTVAALMLLLPCVGLTGNPEDLIQPNRNFSLSEQESQFIQSLPPLKIMVDDDFMPLSYYNTRTGTYEGISVDLFRYIAKRLGLKHEFLRDAKLSWADKVELFKNRKIDLLMSTSFTEERAKYGIFTARIYESFYGAIAKKSRNIKLKSSYDLAAFKIGIIKSTAITPFIKSFVPDQQIIYYENPTELYRGIRSGQVDVGLRNNYVFSEERFNMELFDLSMVHTIVESPRNYSYYLVKSESNRKLVEIIDRYLAGVDYSRLITRYESGEDELVLRFIKQKRQEKILELTIAGVALLLAVVCTAWFYHRKLSKKLAETNRKLETMIITDALTGLSNRRHFDDVLSKEYARHLRSGSTLSLIMLDIDLFKPFNDNYGHVKGDECLQQVAVVIRNCASRAGDLAARYGGEEFVCILPETDLDGAVAIAEKIRKSILDLSIPHKASHVSKFVTASLGVATVKCTMGDPAVDILSHVDEMLYLAKSRGRNRVEYAGRNGGTLPES